MTWLYLRATRANDSVHASLCEVGLGYAPEFRRVMERRGLTVTTYDEAGYRALCGQAVAFETRVAGVGPAQPLPEPPPVQAQAQDEAGLPAVGQEITTELLGRCTVTHVLRYPDGEAVPVAASPRGAELVRAGTWWPWILTPPAHQPAPEQSHDAPPVPEAALVSPTPKPTHMPDLFGDWS